MKIPNPWPHYPMSRANCRTPNGDHVCVQAARGNELDVPEGTTAAMIEPVKATGRGGKYNVVGPAKVWTGAWGLLDVADYEKKMQLEADEARMKDQKQADRLRKQEEARKLAEVDKKTKEMEATAAKEAKSEPAKPAKELADKVEKAAKPTDDRK